MQSFKVHNKTIIEFGSRPRANGAKRRSGRKPGAGRGLLIPHGYLHPGKKANTAKCKVRQ